MGTEQGWGVDTALPGPHPSPHCQLGLAPQPLCTQNMATPPPPRRGALPWPRAPQALSRPHPPPHRGGTALAPRPPGLSRCGHTAQSTATCVCQPPAFRRGPPSWELLSAQIQARTPAFCFSTPKAVCVGGPPPLSVGIHPLYTCGRFSLPTRVPGKALLGCGDKAALLPGSRHLPPLAAVPAGPTVPVLHGGLTVPFLPLLWPFHQELILSHREPWETPATVTREGPCVDPSRLPRGKGRAGSS